MHYEHLYLQNYIMYLIYKCIFIIIIQKKYGNYNLLLLQKIVNTKKKLMHSNKQSGRIYD